MNADRMARERLAEDPYGVPTGGVPRVYPNGYAHPLKCAHGVPPEKCATCESLGVEQAPSKKQVGGTHYTKLAIQPWDYVAANNLGYFEGSIVKYVSRWKDKGGVEDLKKARHFLDKLIEVSNG